MLVLSSNNGQEETMAERQAHSGSLMVPLLAGLAGAGIALLLAPRSGRETREQLKDRAEDMRLQAKEVTDAAAQQIEAGTQQAKEMKERTSSVIRRHTKKHDDLPESLKNNWQEEV
jgi:gas vesicle protein